MFDLRLPDEMKLDLGMGGLERREFALGFLHAVLAEHRLAGGDGLADRIRIMRLRHGDKTHAAGGTARRARAAAPIRALVSADCRRCSWPRP